MRSHTGMFSTKKEQWNPEEVLGLINPDRGYLTCTAEAKTCGRRCRRAQNCMRDAARMLQDMAIMDPLSAAKSDNLYMIARLSVCYQHGGQADEICREWRDKLRQLGSSRKASPRSQSPFVNFKCEPDSEDEFFEDEFLKRNTQRPSQRDYTHADLDSMLEKLRRIQEAINNMQSQKQEEEKRKQAAAEQLRREKAEEAQRQRKEAEEQKKKEQERQARANKQREEFIKERAGKSAAAREQPAKKQWADSWQEYLDGWDHLKGKSCREVSYHMVSQHFISSNLNVGRSDHDPLASKVWKMGGCV